MEEDAMELIIPAETMKKTIAYFYMVSYCPADRIMEFNKTTAGLRKQLAKEGGMAQKNFFPEVIPEVCWRIVAFAQASREPDEEIIKGLIGTIGNATKDEKCLAVFQEKMLEVAALPGRAKADNRLHRKKGCRFCETPCRYGFFSLVSDPVFASLYRTLKTEQQKPKAEQNPVSAVWSFALCHLLTLVGGEKTYIASDHLGNLAYCLLMLSMAKSRYPLPEQQVTAFQEANQRSIQIWKEKEN
jgi:hypothetical protein